MALPWGETWKTSERSDRAEGFGKGKEQGWNPTACYSAYPKAQLRQAPSGSWDGFEVNSGTTGTQCSQDDGDLYSCESKRPLTNPQSVGYGGIEGRHLGGGEEVPFVESRE